MDNLALFFYRSGWCLSITLKVFLMFPERDFRPFWGRKPEYSNESDCILYQKIYQILLQISIKIVKL